MKLGKEFFNRKADIVAKNLLGKILVRKINGRGIKAKIVETEAYFGEEDSASRASKGKTPIFEIMWGEAGKILVYNVHKYVMFCIVTGEKDEPEAILIRALEPLNCDLNLKGPGLLTSSLGISRDYRGKDICNSEDLWIEEPDTKKTFSVAESFRIGVREENPLNLRFYIKDNCYVSKK